jgi:hypothetical protein
MFVIDEAGELRRLKRSPRNRDALELRGWRFLTEASSRWAADDIEAIVNAIPTLFAIRESVLSNYTSSWLKRRAIEHCGGLPIKLTAEPD